jgi:hypothetical protein
MRLAALRLIAGAVLVLILGGGPCLAENPFGLMLWPAGGADLPLMTARAAGLGVGWYRPPAVFIDRWQAGAPCPECIRSARSGLNIALTVRTTGGDGRSPSGPPADLESYKKTLGSILDAWKPTLLVVEQEENLPRFYSGSPTDYTRQLAAACQVSHARGIPCTNGGLSGEAAAALAWLDLLQQARAGQACDFARHAFYAENDPEAGAGLCAYHNAAELPPERRLKLLDGADRLIAVYQAAPVDLVNFHWYGHDAAALASTAHAIARITGKPVMSNEIGQRRWDAESTAIRPLLRAAFAAGLKIAIWFSVDTPSSISLFNPDGSLRQGGREFARQMSGRK